MSLKAKTINPSPSKRLRGVFYILWEQDNQGFEEFESYYNDKLEKVIGYYKSLIKKEE